MSALGRLVVSLGLDAAQYTDGLTKAEAKAQKFANSLSNKVAVGIVKAQVAIEAFGRIAQTAFDFTLGALETAGHFQDLAEQTGQSAEALASFQIAAAVGGTTMELLAAASVKLTKGLSGADEETKGAAQAIQALGFNLEQFQRLKPEDQLEQIAFRLAEFEDGAGKTAFAVQALGKSGAQMLPFLKALAEQGGRQLALTNEQIKAADDYADSQAKFRAEIQVLAQRLAVDVLPVFLDFKKAIIDGGLAMLGFNTESSKFGGNKQIVEFAQNAALAFGTLAETWIGLIRLARAVGGSFQAVGADIAFMAKIATAFRTGRGILGLKAELEERNRIVEEANQRYLDLWNQSGTEITDAMRASFADRERMQTDEFRRIANASQTIGQRPPKKQLSPDLFGGSTSGADKAAKEAEAARKAILDKQLSDLDNFIKAEQRLLDQREAALKRAYGNDQLSISDYFDARVAAIEENRAKTQEAFAKEIAALEDFARKTQAAQAKIDSAAKAKKPKATEVAAARATEKAAATPSEEVAAARTKAEKDFLDIQKQIGDKREEANAAEQKSAEQIQAAYDEKIKAAEAYEDAVAEVRARVLELEGTENAAAEAALIRFDQANRALLRRAAVEPGGERVAADIKRLRDREDAQARLNGLQERATAIQEQLATTEARIDLNRELGIQNEIGAMIDLGKARGDAYRQLVTLADQYERVAREANDGLGDPKLIAKAERFRIEIERLGASADVLGEKLGTLFGDAASGAIEGFLNKTLSAKDAMRQFADDVIKQINRLAAQNIGDAIFGNLFKGAGAGGASAVESAANWFANAIGFTGWGLATGSEAVPHSMVAQVHAGETIVPAPLNRAITAAEQRGADRLTPLALALSEAGSFVSRDTLARLRTGERVVTAYETRKIAAKAKQEARRLPDFSAAEVPQPISRAPRLATAEDPVGLPPALRFPEADQILLPKAPDRAEGLPEVIRFAAIDPALPKALRRPLEPARPERQAKQAASFAGREAVLPKAVRPAPEQKPAPALRAAKAISFAAPSFEAPSFSARFAAPRFDAPRFDAPRFEAPAGPRFAAPSFAAPTFATKFSAPRFEAPSFAVPETRLDPPAYLAPRFEAPSAPSFEAPNFAAPRFAVPQIRVEAPSFAAPRFGAPSFDAPHYAAAPRFTAPSFAAAFDAPSFGAPSFAAPKFAAPEAPSFDAPTFVSPRYARAPTFNAPSFAATFGAPRFDAPQFAAPRFDAPDAPSFLVQSLAVPTLKTGAAGSTINVVGGAKVAATFEAPRFSFPAAAAAAIRFDAPRFSAPLIDIAAPDFSAPKAAFGAPTYEAPSYAAPAFAAPRFAAPSFSAAFDAPRFAAPEAPSFSIPKLVVPRAAEINIEAAGAAAPFAGPGFSVRNEIGFDAPRFSAPSFAAPLIDLAAPSFSAPKFSAPAAGAIRFDAPSFAAPSFAAPIVNLAAPRPGAASASPAAPRFSAPSFAAPSFAAPRFDAPKLAVGPLIDIAAPTLGAPSFAAHFEAPRFDAAKPNGERPRGLSAPAPFASPTFEAPRFTAPTFAVQRLVVPSEKAPTIAAPSFTFDAPAYTIPAAASPRAALIVAGIKAAAERSAATDAQPSFAAPTFGAPRFDAPAFSAPSFAAPRFSAPDFAAPRFEAPAFEEAAGLAKPARRLLPDAPRRAVSRFSEAIERTRRISETEEARAARISSESDRSDRHRSESEQAVRQLAESERIDRRLAESSQINRRLSETEREERSFSESARVDRRSFETSRAESRSSRSERIERRLHQAERAARQLSESERISRQASESERISRSFAEAEEERLSAIRTIARHEPALSRAMEAAGHSVRPAGIGSALPAALAAAAKKTPSIFDRAPELAKAMEFILREQPQLAHVIFSGRGFEVGGMPPIGKASWVGESGPELFVPKTAGTIVPNAALRSIGSGDISVNNTFVLPPGGLTRQTQNQIASRTFIAAQRAIQRGVAS